MAIQTSVAKEQIVCVIDDSDVNWIRVFVPDSATVDVLLLSIFLIIIITTEWIHPQEVYGIHGGNPECCFELSSL